MGLEYDFSNIWTWRSSPWTRTRAMTFYEYIAVIQALSLTFGKELVYY